MRGGPVVVVGGGISGLSAAWNLQQAGREVIVLEAEVRAGGTIGSVREQDCLIESGPNSVLDTSPLIGKVIEATGIAAQRVAVSTGAKKRFVLRAGKLVPLPLSPFDLIATGLFSARAKFALLREPFIARGAEDIEETVAQFVRRRIGEEFLDYAVDPFVAGVYAGDPERLSLRAAFPRLHELERRHGSLIRGQLLGARERKRNPERSKQAAPMFSFRDGMQTLPDALASRLSHLSLSTRVTGLARDPGGGWTVSSEGPGGATQRHAGAVVLAVPAYAAATLVRPLSAVAGDALDEIVYPPVAVVVSAYAREALAHPLDGFGFLAPKKEHCLLLGTIFSSSLLENRAPQGTALLTSFVGGMRQPERAQAGEAEIAAAVHEEHARLLGARAQPRWARVRRWPRAIPQYGLGHLDRMAILAGAEQSLPGLFFCANYRGGISVADCIKSGHATAERVAAHPG